MANEYLIRCSDGSEEELDKKMISDTAALSKTITRACEAKAAATWELFFVGPRTRELLARVERLDNRSIQVVEVNI